MMLRRIIHLSLLFVALGSALASNTVIVVRNALLMNPDDPGADQLVSVVVKKGTLNLITADPVPDKKNAVTVDATGGVILGQLNVGEPASFMVLDEDPRKNNTVLFDTKSHIVFAIADGEIAANKLQAAAPDSSPEEEQVNWFAYAAPPMALSTSYKNQNNWNRVKRKHFSFALLGALALDRMAWVGQDETSETQVGDLEAYNEGEIRALRFGAVGSINLYKPWIFTFFAATSAFDKGFDRSVDDGFGIFDARVDIPFYRDTTLSIGKQKEPISMERLTSLVHLPMQERTAASDAMMPSRNTGLVLSGTGFNRRTSWAGGIFNPWLDSETSFEDTATQLVGRGTWLPVQNRDQSSLVHVGVGVRYSDAKNGIQYATEPEFYSAPLFVDTEYIDADQSMLYNLEVAWRWGPMLISGEYNINPVDADSAGDPIFTGYHAQVSYVLTGEMRPYNNRSGIFLPVPVAKSVSSNGWGAWELSGRFSNLDLNEGAVQGGELNIYSLGLNWWLSTAASFSINYRNVVLDDLDGRGHSDGIMTRITLLLE